jgi:hypothetical protein
MIMSYGVQQINILLKNSQTKLNSNSTRNCDTIILLFLILSILMLKGNNSIPVVVALQF